MKLGLSAVAVVAQITENLPSSSANRNSASSSFPQRVMHSVTAAIEYVCSTTTAANVGPTTSLCTAGNPTLPMAAIAGASATVADRTTSFGD